jgi:hypothetical protein
LLKFEQIAIRVSDEETVNAKLLEPMWRLGNIDTQVNQPPIPGIDFVGDNRDHATPWFDHTLVKGLAHTDSSIAHGRENSRVTLVTKTLESQHFTVEDGACLEVVGIYPTDLCGDVRFAIFQVAAPSGSRISNPGDYQSILFIGSDLMFNNTPTV